MLQNTDWCDTAYRLEGWGGAWRRRLYPSRVVGCCFRAAGVGYYYVDCCLACLVDIIANYCYFVSLSIDYMVYKMC